MEISVGARTRATMSVKIRPFWYGNYWEEYPSDAEIIELVKIRPFWYGNADVELGDFEKIQS